MTKRSILTSVCILVLGGLLAGCALLDGRPTARFVITPLVVYAGEQVTFDAGVSAGGRPIVTYDWDLGDGTAASGREVTSVYEKPGVYDVRLRVEDAAGQRDELAASVPVYLRSGEVLLWEDFSEGEAALDDWQLDATWASAEDGTIESRGVSHGYALHVRSSDDRWHRRFVALDVPPLRVGQRLILACDVMLARAERGFTFSIFPLRATLEAGTAELPFFVQSGEQGGAYVMEPAGSGDALRRLLPAKLEVYRWYTCTFVLSANRYEFHLDGEALASGSTDEAFASTGEWLLVLGDESHTEGCDTYFDEISVSVSEAAVP